MDTRNETERADRLGEIKKKIIILNTIGGIASIAAGLGLFATFDDPSFFGLIGPGNEAYIYSVMGIGFAVSALTTFSMVSLSKERTRLEEASESDKPTVY